MFNKKILYFIIGIFFSTNAFADISASKGVHLIESTNSGVTIKFQPKAWTIDSLKLGDKNYIKLDFLHASFEAQPGTPVIPVMPVTIGIPLESPVDFAIIATQTETISGSLLPQPKTSTRNKLSSYQYIENNKIYEADAFYPQQIVEIGEPAFFRNQRIVSVLFKPVQFNPVQNNIRLYKEITVKITFSGTQQDIYLEKQRSSDDDFYENVLLNHRQAETWRKPQTKSLKKYNSIFSSDTWYQIFVKNEGMYKITGTDLVKYGIDIKAIDPGKIKIYNNGGRELNLSNSAATIDSLVENAIIVNDGGDGVFDILDYIIFYGKSVHNWDYNAGNDKYNHYVNRYEDLNVYWLTWSGSTSGKRMTEITTADIPSITPEPYFINHYYFEQNIINHLNSGLNWFSRFFSPSIKYTFTADLFNADPESTQFQFHLAGASSGRHSFTIYVNDSFLASSYSYVQNFFDITQTASGLIRSGYNNIRLEYSSNEDDAQAYLDWFEIHYRRGFTVADNYLQFFTSPSTSIKRYSLTNFSNNDISIFDVTNYDDTKILKNVSIANNQASFTDDRNLESVKRMIAIASTAYLVPETINSIEINDLRNPQNGADFIIITHDDFYEAVQPFAQHRQAHDNLTTIVVKTSDIFNQFSWGLFDPTAIRNFIRHAYNYWSIKPNYILLWGDGDYDYKNVISTADKNWVPPYETTELDEDTNRSSDDWFVRINGNDNYPDMAIGRMPVRSVEETQNVVNKLIAYDTGTLLDNSNSSSIDDWRNVVLMVGDDELVENGVGNEIIHTTDAENIIEYYVPNKYDKKKIYLSEYTAIRNMSIYSTLLKPTAAEAIIDQINTGALILNYIGHGNPSTWSHEYVLWAPRDFNKIQNGSKQALWIAATCDFGRFDDPSTQSLAEDLIKSGTAGAIGILASTREAYAHNNAALNRAFYSHLFKNQQQIERIGTALLFAKIDNGSSVNDQKYVLLGDPTMRLSAPQYDVNIRSIQPDTLKALSRVKLSGYVTKDNALWDSFNGKILVKAYDSKKKRNYVTEKGSSIRYVLPGNAIFKGVDNVKNGEFNVRFIVPKDITYGANLGRINLYYANSNLSGAGYRDSLLVGGTAAIIDSDGPIINVGLEDNPFFNGGFVDDTPTIKIDIADSVSGINITGDIGHNISMIVDDDTENKIILTDLFKYNEGSYTNGTVLFDFNTYKRNIQTQNSESAESIGLQEGLHTIEIKAWDNSNNSSIINADLTVISNSKLEIKNVLNYPNPFDSQTTFSFWCNQDTWVSINIYTIAGRLIQKIDDFFLETNQPAQVEWDGRDKDGDMVANGVYFYRVKARATVNGKSRTKEVIQKLVVMR